MRTLKNTANAFIPKHEKEWDARLFIDKAIKGEAQYALEAIARALSGRYEIKFSYAPKDAPFKHKESIHGDKDKWVDKTTLYPIEATMAGFIFYGQNETQIYCKIIDWWAGKEIQFPCGGAFFPNEGFEIKEKKK